MEKRELKDSLKKLRTNIETTNEKYREVFDMGFENLKNAVELYRLVTNEDCIDWTNDEDEQWYITTFGGVDYWLKRIKILDNGEIDTITIQSENGESLYTMNIDHFEWDCDSNHNDIAEDIYDRIKISLAE